MQISWINKFTMLDFPWKVACIIFTPWCNFRCPFCHNPEFVLPALIKNSISSLISEKSFFTFLEKRKWLLDWVTICWWEPTLQKDLVSFCEKIKQMWFAVKIDTNGRDPKMIKELLDKKVVDYIAMDIKHSPQKFSEIAKIKLDEKIYFESIDLIKNSWIDYEFRTTVVKWIHTENDIEELTSFISWAKKYCIQNYRSWNTLKQNFAWESFSKKELKEFKNIALKYIKKVEIRE